LLGFDRADGDIAAPSFHPMFHMGQNGGLFVNMVVELVQTSRKPFGEVGAGDFPLRNGVTLLISQDPPQDGIRPAPRIRFVITKLHSPEREERVRTYYLATGRSNEADVQKKGDARFQIDFGLLHAGV
jgi:hypothetical protein